MIGIAATRTVFLTLAALAFVCRTAAQGRAPAECFEYSSFSPLRGQPGQDFSDGLSIPDAFPVNYVRLYIDLSHPDTSQLELELSAEPPEELPTTVKSRMKKIIRLKDQGKGSGSDMTVTFADNATNVLGVEKLDGEFQPEQILSFLYSKSGDEIVIAPYGGSQGIWTLHVQDKNPEKDQRVTPKVNQWRLVLCPEPTPIKMPPVQTFDDQTETDSMPYKPWTINEHGQSQNAAEEDLAEKFNDFIKSESSQLCGSEAECEQLRARFWKAMAAATLMKDKNGDDEKNGKRITGSKDSMQVAKIRSSLKPVTEKLAGKEDGFKEIFKNFPRPTQESDLASKIGSIGGDFMGKAKKWQSEHGLRSGDLGDKIPSLSDIRSNLGARGEKVKERMANLKDDVSGRSLPGMEDLSGKVRSKIEKAGQKLDSWRDEHKLDFDSIPDLSSIRSKLESSKSGITNKLKNWREKHGLQKKMSDSIGDIIKESVKEQMRSYGIDEKELRSLDPILDGLGHRNSSHLYLDELLSGKGLSFNFGEGSKGLNLDGPLGTKVVGNLLGIDDPEEAKALVEGLKEAGFQDLMREFLDPALNLR
eukprot:jgi/Picsp_1/2240/NSC_05704-R1_hypothetical protein CHLNCDRAFT_135933 [Chlorella variabilis]